MRGSQGKRDGDEMGEEAAAAATGHYSLRPTELEEYYSMGEYFLWIWFSFPP
jgi:hypothetical protein